MRGETIRAMERIRTLSSTEWETIRVRALAARVGGYAWEQAWMAAKTGHAAGIAAQQRATAYGASTLAAAAVAGAVAAIQAANLLSAEDYRTLTDPVGAALGGPGPVRATSLLVQRFARFCPVAAALYG